LITVTVSQLNRYLKAVLEGDKKLSNLYVCGEISNFTRHRQSGHLYFSLKDKDSALRAVMFRQDAGDLRFQPENGMEVLAGGHVSVYERDGAYQLIVNDMQPRGAGAMAVQFAQTKERLEGEGLFAPAHKKPLPPYPRRVGVVTSADAAALQDIRRVLSRRYPLCALVVSPAQVQGAGSARALTDALNRLSRRGNCDVIIIGRGGGSAEDLWSFNDEGLARAIFACKAPVISAVGHETDYTICDFVSDVRASTPSVAAQLAAPDQEELLRRLSGLQSALRRHAADKLYTSIQRLDRLSGGAAPGAYENIVAKKQEKLDFFSHLIYNNKRIFIQERQNRLAELGALLNSVSPLRVMDRGYCAAFRDKEAVRTVRRLAQGDELRLRFCDGWADCTVDAVTIAIPKGIHRGLPR